MAFVELELLDEAEILGISSIACSDGAFSIVYLGKEYSCAFPSAIWGIDKDQLATVEYLYDRLTNGDGPIPAEVATFISKTIKQDTNWKLVNEHADTLENETRELNAKTAINKIDHRRNGNEDGNEDLSEEEKRIQELINTPVTEENINLVFETLYKEAPYDKISIKQLFYGMCSAFTKTGIPHNVNSKDSGAGKNYLLELCSKVFPDKYVNSLLVFLIKRLCISGVSS